MGQVVCTTASRTKQLGAPSKQTKGGAARRGETVSLDRTIPGKIFTLQNCRLVGKAVGLS